MGLVLAAACTAAVATGTAARPGTDPSCYFDFATLDELMQSQTPELFAEYWRRNFQLAVTEGFPHADQASLPSIRVAWRIAFERDYPIARILARMGFRVGRSAERTTVEVPTLQEVVTAYETILREHVDAGRLTAGGAIRPGRAFLDGEGTLHFIGVLETPNPSWRLIPLRLLHGNVLGRMIAAGFFPLSNGDRVHHDFAHLAAMLQHPEYMQGLRHFFTALQSGPDRPPVAAPPDPRPVWRRIGSGIWEIYRGLRGQHRPAPQPRADRAFYALEGLALVPAENREALRPFLSPLLRNAGDRLVTVTELRTALLEEPTAFLIARANRLLANYRSLVNAYGGSSSELGMAYTGEANLQDTFAVRARMLRSFVNDPNPNPRNIADGLARLEVALWESTRVSLEVFFRDFARAELPTTSPLYRYFIQSGILQGPFPGTNVLESPLYRSLLGGRLPEAPPQGPGP